MGGYSVLFVLPRPWEDGTVAVLRAEVDDSALDDPLAFKEALKAALTEWRDTTPEGVQAWEDSGLDFNVGDLEFTHNRDLTEILRKRGIRTLTVECFEGGHGWEFDDVLMEDAEKNVAP